MEYAIMKHAGRCGIVRVLPSGEAAGYDAVADREGWQVHYRIYSGTPTMTAEGRAFADPLTRKYESVIDAEKDAAASGRIIDRVFC